MAKELTSGMLWNSASKDGLILGAATVAFALASTYASKLGVVAGALAGFILLAGKITACILLVKFFLNRLHRNSGAGARTLYGYGLRVVLFSSLIVAAYSLAAALSVSPEEYMKQMNDALASMPVQMDSNTLDAFEKILPSLPAINFFSSLVYCFIWGWILSAIFSKSAAPNDLFEENRKDSFSDNR